MNKISRALSVFSVAMLLCAGSGLWAASQNIKTYEGKGAVKAVSPVFSRITIKHDLIKGFSEAQTEEFSVSQKSLIEKIRKGDLVVFRITDNRGDVFRIDQITKTGVAPVDEQDTPVQDAVRNVLTGTSEVIDGVTKPVEPANKLTGSVMGATSDSTTSVLKDAPEVKTEF